MHGPQIATASAMIALTSGLAAGQIIIDDFSDGDFEQSSRANSMTMIEAPSVLGGERELEVTIISNPFNTRISTQTAFAGTNGFSLESGPGLIGQAMLTYDGDGSPGTGLDIDADANGIQSVFIDHSFNDAVYSIEVELTDGSGNTIAQTQAVPVSFSSQGIFFVLDLFTATGGGGTFDSTDIDAVSVTFNVNPTDDTAGLDLFVQRIEFSTEVPSPGSALLMAAGGLLTAGRRRR